MPTKARYLKQFWISWATPIVEYNPGALRGISRADVVLGINKKVQAFNPLTNLISSKLRLEKRLLSPEITYTHINISNVESLNFALYPMGKNKPLGLYSSFYMDPLELLDLPDDASVIGELGIKIVEEFLENLAFHEYAIKDFPTDIFTGAIEDFRAKDMKVGFRPVQKEIAGSSVKAVFTIEDSPNETVIMVSFVKARTTLYSTEISRSRGGLGSATATALQVIDVKLCEDAIEISGIKFPSLDTLRLRFGDLPSNLADILRSETS